MSTRVTQAEFARWCGVRRQTVHDWIKAGRIRKGDDGLLDLAEATRMRAATESPMPHHQASKRRFAEAKARCTPSGGQNAHLTNNVTGKDGDPAEIDALNERIALETLRLHRHKAELARLEIERKVASLVDRAEVDAVLAEFLATLERIVGAIPARLAPEIAGHGARTAAIHRSLEGAMHGALIETSDYFARLAGEPTEGGS